MGAKTLDRYALCEATVTLNGQRAKVSGAGLDYARVTDVATGLSAEWSWEAVARVVANGGAFTS
jgi:hypothetical protein